MCGVPRRLGEPIRPGPQGGVTAVRARTGNRRVSGPGGLTGPPRPAMMGSEGLGSGLGSRIRAGVGAWPRCPGLRGGPRSAGGRTASPRVLVRSTRLTRGRDFGGGGRYRTPPAWIDRVIATDPALSGVRLSYQPRYLGRLEAHGQATLEEPGVPGYTSIGRPSLSSRKELLDTIIHEETHHRLWRRARAGSLRAWDKIADIDLEEDYVEGVAVRFLRLQDRRRSTRETRHG